MERRTAILLVAAVALGAIGVGLQAADEQNAKYTVRILALPDHGQGNITMDYIAYDPKTGAGRRSADRARHSARSG